MSYSLPNCSNNFKLSKTIIFEANSFLFYSFDTRTSQIDFVYLQNLKPSSFLFCWLDAKPSQEDSLNYKSEVEYIPEKLRFGGFSKACLLLLVFFLVKKHNSK